MTPILVFGGFFAIVACIVFFAWLSERKRAEALQALAASMKLSFARKDDAALLPTLSKFHLFSQGSARKLLNVMRGSFSGIDITIMDYQYTTGGGKNSQTYNQTVILFRSALLQLPEFTLRPEHVFDRVGQVFGRQDIDFDAHPSFSKQYLLRGADENAVRSLFNDALLAHFEQSKGLSAEGSGDTFIYYRASKRVTPENITAFIQEGVAVFALVKVAE